MLKNNGMVGKLFRLPDPDHQLFLNKQTWTWKDKVVFAGMCCFLILEVDHVEQIPVYRVLLGDGREGWFDNDWQEEWVELKEESE